MNFQTAVTTVLTQKYADFNGRARRSEFWFFVLFFILAAIALQIIGGIIGSQILYYVFALAVLVPYIAVTARRLHDGGRSGWWQLLSLTVIGGFVVLVWVILDGNPGDNQYGPSPKRGEAYDPKATGGWGQPQV